MSTLCIVESIVKIKAIISNLKGDKKHIQIPAAETKKDKFAGNRM